MTHAEVLDALTNVFRDVFDDNSIVINDQTTANDIEDWDSLEHINLIEAVEKEFNMRFQMREVSGMKNVGEMVDIIIARAKPKKEKAWFLPLSSSLLQQLLPHLREELFFSPGYLHLRHIQQFRRFRLR